MKANGALKGRRFGCRGAALVETALILPVSMALLFGVLEGGHALFDYNLLTHAAREGARLAAVTPSLKSDDPVVVDRIRKILASGGMRAKSVSVSFVENRVVLIRVEAEFVPAARIVWLGAMPIKVEVRTHYEQ